MGTPAYVFVLIALEVLAVLSVVGYLGFRNFIKNSIENVSDGPQRNRFKPHRSTTQISMKR